MDRSWAQLNRRRNSLQGTDLSNLNYSFLEEQCTARRKDCELYRSKQEKSTEASYSSEKSNRERVIQATEDEEKTLFELDKLDIVISPYHSGSEKDFNRSQKFCQPMSQEIPSQGTKYFRASSEARSSSKKTYRQEVAEANSAESNNKQEMEVLKKGFHNLQIALDAARLQLADSKKVKNLCKGHANEFPVGKISPRGRS